MTLFRRSWVVFGLWLIALIGAANTAAPIFFNLTYLLGAIIILSFVWAWSNINWLRLTRETFARRSRVGELAEERFWVENRSFLPKLWVEIRDHSNLPGHRASHVISGLGGKKRQSHTVRTPCLRRGRYHLGPITVTSGDPFGLFTMRRDLPLESALVVFPRSFDLPHFDPLMGEITGGEAIYRRTHYTTTNVSGVRDYAPGDSFNRIHWPSTARANRLIAKEFELDPMADVWVVLDMHREAHVGPAFDELPEPEIPQVPWERWVVPDLPPNTEEYCISVTASLVRFFLGQKRMVGFISYAHGDHAEMAEGDRGERQEDRLMEMLAVIHPYGTISLEHVLIAQGSRFSRNTTLMVVTPSVKPSWAIAARHLSSRGVKVAAVVVDPGSFGATYNADDILVELAASHIPHYRVQNGDSISDALANVPG
jgi:uncharacterized protein (DUF58 family)